MKRSLCLIVPWFLAACGAASPAPTALPPGYNATKLFQLTAEMETVTAAYPKNDATLTAILATKSAGGTAAAATMTAQPTETFTPTIPPDSLFCRPADLQTSFRSMGATQNILLGAGLTNVSGSPCFLQAWPQVLLTDPHGQPLEVDYHYFEMGPADAAAAATEQARDGATAKFGLLPGWTAWLNLIWSNWCGKPITGGAVIRLTLAGQAGSLAVQTDLDLGGTCNAPDYRSSVGIAKLDQAQPAP